MNPEKRDIAPLNAGLMPAFMLVCKPPWESLYTYTPFPRAIVLRTATVAIQANLRWKPAGCRTSPS
ncbi:hypothetical protein KR51_00012960 [Rubidibacter lacunae KORDI 51-2]|uniref:Uncharacterized protein n=1 Tax=Rubidibacter lacunae KORDI 51-2 TaxID=582515 RepID=U5DJV0_9CHRO|nr:hypothetical protein KR51_00012960 [Rubidibacter lacunae KORDI 51-2]